VGRFTQHKSQLTFTGGSWTNTQKKVILFWTPTGVVSRLPSLAIACHDYGYDLTSCEIDKGYFEASMKRVNKHLAQTKLPF
jgi:hypothetical protein